MILRTNWQQIAAYQSVGSKSLQRYNLSAIEVALGCVLYLEN